MDAISASRRSRRTGLRGSPILASRIATTGCGRDIESLVGASIASMLADAYTTG
jgi:hypothetical protein